MDPGLLRRYNEELAYLREVGAEFAADFPKIAARLTLDGVEVADPYVERLLEGFAFLTARVQLKLDAEYPQLLAHLFETLYPNFLAPVPSMLVARLEPDLNNPALATGAIVPRGAALSSAHLRGQATRCEFRTAHAVPLWPITLEDVRVFTHTADLPISQLPVSRLVRGGLRLRLRAHGGLKFNQIPLDRLPLFIAAPGDTGYRLHELIGAATLGSMVTAPQSGAALSAPFSVASSWRGATSVRTIGFDDDEALLPPTHRGFSGYRLVQELVALPQRYFFFELTDLQHRLQHINEDTVDVVLLFSRGEAALEPVVDAQSLALHCTPAVNLFSKRLDRVQTGTHAAHYHLVPDRTRPMDFEVHTIQSVTGYGTGPVGTQSFTPLYSAWQDQAVGEDAYFTVKREQRLLSQRQRQQGTRSSYVGTEVFMAIVDAAEHTNPRDVRQLAVSAWVTNRDLPMLLPGAGANAATVGAASALASHSAAPDWLLDGAPYVARVDCLSGPTRPIQRAASGNLGWAMVNQLSLNHLSISGEDPKRAAAALRSMLALHGGADDAMWRKQIEGILEVRAQRSTRRLPFSGPLTFGCGVGIDIDVDENAFQGGSAFLLGSVLERLLARQAGINSFAETAMRSSTRGSIMRWPPRIGQAPLI